MDVMCRKYSCIYNDRAKCTRKNLNISEHADCGDLIMNNDKIVEDVSLDMFEHEPDLAPFHHCKTMFIRCSCLVCIYNKSGECYSNGIFVGSEIDDAPCNSYVPK
ncbi:MAG TPA: hypothetical protein IAC46_00995 [Candidatus Onthoplasma faecigallinarum]|nr:hypothetical protein [Candidatus Onthoplasma faecigallinarum]